VRARLVAPHRAGPARELHEGPAPTAWHCGNRSISAPPASLGSGPLICPRARQGVQNSQRKTSMTCVTSYP